MADKYINETGVSVIRDWANGKFALDADLDALDAKVDEIISEGGEPNVIETVKVNGTALVPDANKAVDVTVPTKLSDLTNDGDGTTGSRFATEAYVDTNGGKIDKIQVNGTDQTITNKTVNITVPTKVSDLTNDSAFQTETQVDAKISAAVTSAYKYKGSVATVADLPASGNVTGDVYDVQATGINYAWTGTAWDALGQLIDTSLLWSKAELTAMTVAEINAILNPSA